MRTRPEWAPYFLGIAKAVAARSHDAETQVGCVIVDQRKRVISTGYNGFPPGFRDDVLPDVRPAKYPYMIHAEVNAIASCKTDLNGATLYCTHSPCADCVKAIITSGIRSVVYATRYPGHEHVSSMLRMARIHDVWVQE
jgi:dCMP deaminase